MLSRSINYIKPLIQENYTPPFVFSAKMIKLVILLTCKQMIYSLQQTCILNNGTNFFSTLKLGKTLHYFVTLIFIMWLLTFSFSADAALIRSATSGNWSTGSTWLGGVAPGCNDSIVIEAGHSISISSNITFACASYIPISLTGTLVFSNGRKLTLPCGSRLYIFGQGIVTGTGGGGSNSIEICGTQVWQSGSGNVSGPSCLPITLPGCGTVLPIKLKTFTSNNCGNNVCHAWVTASEKYAHSFCLEKSRDGLSFNQLACQPSKAPNGFSQSELFYTYEEQDASKGTSYYRLRQIDKDGSFTYFSLTSVDVQEDDVPFKIQPNPSAGLTTLVLPKPLSSFEVRIYDFTGKLLQRYEAQNTAQVQINLYQSGVYLCRLSVGNQESTTRLVVE